MTAQDASLLREMQGIWRDKYVIKAGNGWSAQRIGATEIIAAETGFELRTKITQDAIKWNRQRFQP